MRPVIKIIWYKILFTMISENATTTHQEPGPTAVSGLWAAFKDIDGSFGGKV